MKQRKHIRNLSLVKFNPNFAPKDWEFYKHYRDLVGKTFVYLGEIVNMPGHGIFVDYKSGKCYNGYHIDEFSELTE